MPARLRVRAFAKINLSLRVLDVRDDGYHGLRTVFQSLALHDTLVVTGTRDAFAITCDDPACPADRTNLVWRAAEQAWRAAGRRGAPRGLHVEINKRIPMQAGLGGGSSDAAAMLRACSVLWKIRPAAVRDVASELGADVSYFLEGGTALGLERGDILYPLEDLKAAWVALVLPPFGISTPDAYAWFDQSRGRRGSSAPRPEWPAAWPAVDAVNDLEAPVVARHPAIGRIVRRLRDAGARPAAMSGSGSAVFGLFASRAAAEAALPRAGAYRAQVTRTLGRRAFQAQAAPAALAARG